MKKKNECETILGRPVKKIISYNDGVPSAWIDLLGGVHDSGCGTDPSGVDCGECPEISCENCPIYNSNK